MTRSLHPPGRVAIRLKSSRFDQASTANMFDNAYPLGGAGRRSGQVAELAGGSDYRVRDNNI